MVITNENFYVDSELSPKGSCVMINVSTCVVCHKCTDDVMSKDVYSNNGNGVHVCLQLNIAMVLKMCQKSSVIMQCGDILATLLNIE